jgi:hypothetical protein
MPDTKSTSEIIDPVNAAASVTPQAADNAEKKYDEPVCRTSDEVADSKRWAALDAYLAGCPGPDPKPAVRTPEPIDPKYHLNCAQSSSAGR